MAGNLSPKLEMELPCGPAIPVPSVRKNWSQDQGDTCVYSTAPAIAKVKDQLRCSRMDEQMGNLSKASSDFSLYPEIYIALSDCST